MTNKRIFVIEDVLELKSIENLFKRNLRKEEYELVTRADLSDEKVFMQHFPEGYDIYWFHTSAIEEEAIDELKIKQPWSKLIARVRTRDTDPKSPGYGYFNYMRKKVDYALSHDKEIDEKRVREVFELFDVKLSLMEEVKND